jgi:hypothetical protein
MQFAIGNDLQSRTKSCLKVAVATVIDLKGQRWDGAVMIYKYLGVV